MRILLCLALTTAPCLAQSTVADSVPAAKTPARPNIIFILADDLGWGDVGFNGQQHIETPSLDAMAKEGIVLTSHYAGSTVCMPSRCALLTGYHMGHATVRGNPRWTFTGKPVNIGAADVTIAKELKRAGYRTAIMGKWGLAEGGDDGGMPGRHGFDDFYGYRTHGAAHHYYPTFLWRNDQKEPLPNNQPRKKLGAYTHDLIVNESLAWVRKHHAKPFFLYLAFTIPHYELTVPEDSKKPYLGRGWPKKKMRQNRNGRGYHHDREGNVAYAGMVSRMDRDIGRLRKLLTDLSIADNTLIVFSSDNGPEYEKKDRFFNSNGPFRGGKRDLYEGGIRVPCVAVWPRAIAPGTKSDHPSAFWDVLPTLCEAAGLAPTKKDLDGTSFLPTLLGKAQPAGKPLYWEFNEGKGPVQAARDGEWKVVRFLAPTRVELYNLRQDPGETRDLAEAENAPLKKMLQMLERARTDSAAFRLKRHPRARKRPKKAPENEKKKE